jgi:hypothetical protein
MLFMVDPNGRYQVPCASLAAEPAVIEAGARASIMAGGRNELRPRPALR